MDNRYYKYGCPALMQDKHYITNYMPKRTFDQIIRNLNKIDSIYDYKYFLQTNTETILNKERAKLYELYTCNVSGKCVPLSNTPYNYVKYTCGCPKQFDFLPDEKHIENTCGCKSYYK